METIATALGIVLALVCCASAVMDFIKHPKVTRTMSELGIAENRLVILGILKVAGAAGLLLGLSRDWLALVSGVCLSAYFLIATSTHVRVRHGMKNTLPPLVLTVAAALFTLTILAK